ncbi:MAG: branched-chain amino acid ABC transporter substrate-binding protein [Pseudomonadota bacterium]|nr:branched-chain amino acid ABC transporter substrate-binding protein [Pseudomonadota bacterium]
MFKLLCVSFFLSTVAFSKTDSAAIKIGVAGPFTGAYAMFGKQLWEGTTLAAKSINAEGGINGRKIELVKGDDACEPKQAVAVANKFVEQDKVDAVVGHFCSSSTIPAARIYNDARTVMITPASTNPKVTGMNYPMVFRTCGRDDQQGIVAAAFIANRLQAKRVAIIHDKDTYGQGLADETRKNLKKAKITEVLYEGLTRGEKDFSALVTKIKAKRADAVFFGGIHAEAGLLVKQMRQQGLKAHFISGDGIVSEDFVVVAGGTKFVDGVYMTYSREPRDEPTAAKVVATFRKNGFEPEGYTLYAYAAMQALVAAMQKNKAATGKRHDSMAVAKWLKSNPVATVLGKKEWDKNGDLTAAGYVIYKWNDKGKYKVLETGI